MNRAAVASVCLCFGESGGGNVFQLIVLGHNAFRHDSETHTDRHANRLPFVTEGKPLDGAADAFTQNDGSVERGFRSHDDEFLSADAAYGIHSAHRSAEHLAQIDQNLVTARDEVAGVDILEVIGVDKAEGE